MTIEELEKKMAELDELQAETENAHAKLKAQMAELEKLQAETENAHAELIAQIAELKALREEPPKPPHPSWLPQEHENYYTIMSDGTPDTRQWHDSIDGGTSIRRYSLGNVFKAKEAAEFAVERLKVLAEMREWAGEWRNVYTLAWDNIHHKIITYASLVYQGEMCFATREDAENCIKAVGEERLKKYYFMIPEEETKNG